MHILKLILVSLLLLFTSLPLALAARPQIIKPYDSGVYETQMASHLRALPHTEYVPIEERLFIASEFFLGKPYFLFALGEGPAGLYDQQPLYRTDKFDCLTYVSTVLAMSQSNSIDDFKQHIRQIRYKNGQVNYVNRNHFTSIDWNINNAKKGYIKDITNTITDKSGQKIAIKAIAVINKANWYRRKNGKDIRLLNSVSRREGKKRLKDFNQLGKGFKPQEAEIYYIPLDKLFTKNDQPDQYIFSQIPSGSVIEIVRPNWNRKDIGTRLNVSHLGFAFWRNDTLIFREASSVKNKVIDISLEDYLRNSRKSKTIKGINIQQVMPPASLKIDKFAD